MSLLQPLVLALVLLAPRPESGALHVDPGPAEAAVPEPFRLTPARFSFEMEPIRSAETHSVWAVRFPSPIESPDPVNNTVHAEYFLPRTAAAGRRPGVVVLHILGADFALSRYLAARLADRGVAALFMKLPYYGERRPPGVRFLSADMERSMLAMRQGVCDVRRAAAWLASRPEVDRGRVGVTGISLGGIVASVAAAVDPQIESAALLLAGGGLARILWDLPEPEARRYREAWLASGRGLDDLQVLTGPVEPLTHAHGLAAKRVLMIAGTVDEVIPPASARALWEAAGRPPIVWYDCGHYSAVGYLLPAIQRTVDFFAPAVEPPAPGASPPPTGAG